MQTDTKKRILIHARGQMTADEVMFWDSLHRELAAGDVGLYIIAHHRPRFEHVTPFLMVPNMPHNAPTADWGGTWGAIASAGNLLREGELLEREGAWRGTGTTELVEQRRRGLFFFYDFYGQALKAVRPSVVIIWNGMHAQEMILDELSRKAGCCVGYIERAPIPGMIHLDWEGILGGSSIAARTDWNWQSESERSMGQPFHCS